MSTNGTSPSGRRRHLTGCLAAALLFVLVPVGAGLGFLGWLAITDSKEAYDHLWGSVAMAGAAGMVLGGLLAVTFVWTQKSAVWIVAVGFLIAGVIADVATVALGVLVVLGAQARGGDWGALAVATAKLFCVAVPIASAILTAIALACVWYLPKQTSARFSLLRSRPG
ncbi:MAG: hypothetical protein K1X57_00945 [Gemmataceae bacterium]|nr:hypothetical protein [Gemmataceae bacterium]